jgi:hypothetical protein
MIVKVVSKMGRGSRAGGHGNSNMADHFSEKPVTRELAKYPPSKLQKPGFL